MTKFEKWTIGIGLLLTTVFGSVQFYQNEKIKALTVEANKIAEETKSEDEKNREVAEEALALSKSIEEREVSGIWRGVVKNNAQKVDLYSFREDVYLQRATILLPTGDNNTSNIQITSSDNYSFSTAMLKDLVEETLPTMKEIWEKYPTSVGPFNTIMGKVPLVIESLYAYKGKGYFVSSDYELLYTASYSNSDPEVSPEVTFDGLIYIKHRCEDGNKCIEEARNLEKLSNIIISENAIEDTNSVFRKSIDEVKIFHYTNPVKVQDNE
ncbi:hypothetical protein [Halalkalibacter flavus]|uniref:hypothetical protein n=1 Tax=Halalkalibacter flavus TaxID=3090668 RepID=UPI002FC87FB3